MIKVLTVDDSRTMRDMLRLALAGGDFAVTQAVDGEHGLEVLSESGADVIITDINMPKLDGFGFIERVREDADYRATPILVLTAKAQTARRLTLVWGVHPVIGEDIRDVTEMAERGAEAALREGFAIPGQRIILVAGVPFGTPGATNMIRIAFVNADAKG